MKLRVTVMVILIGVLAACGGNGGESGGSGGDADADRTELRLAIGGESEDGYDPTLGWGRYGSPLFQSTLLARDANLDIVNDLATDYSVSEDGLVWTVTIRDDAVFTDGEPVTAEDVAYTFTTAASSVGLTDVTALVSAEATDASTVELRLDQPQSTFVNSLITLGIVPAHLHDETYSRNPVGSGPFEMVQWDEGQQLIVQRNDDYYGEQPSFERVVFVFTGEDASLAAGRAGEVELVSVPSALANVDIADMELLPVPSVDNRGIMFPFVPGGTTTDSGLAVGNDVTSDRAIRQAVNLVVDRQALVDGVLNGHGSPAYGPADGLPWFEPASIIEDADLDAAVAVLEDGGWVGDGIRQKDGVTATFRLIYPAGDSIRQGIALAVADQVRPAGVEIVAEAKSWDEIANLMHSEAVLFGWGSHNPNEIYNLYHSALAGVEYWNTGFYASEAVDAHLDAAMTALSEDDAIDHWKKAQLDDDGNGFSAPADAAWAWLVNLDHTYFVNECLDLGEVQVEPHGHGWPITAGITGWTWTC